MPRPKLPRSKKGASFTKKLSFLAAYAATASIGLAAEKAHVKRQNHYEWLRAEQGREAKDREYTNAWETIQDEVAQTLEDEAVRRAHQGVKRPVLYKGEPVKINRRVLYHLEYSDQLLALLLKRFRPALYREHVTTEHSGSIEIVERLHAARKRLFEMRKADDRSATG